MVDAMTDRFACLMANHGMLAAGRDLNQAMWRATELEALARQYQLALATGRVATLDGTPVGSGLDLPVGAAIAG